MLASNSCTIIVHIISERKKKEIMKIKDKIKFVDSKVIEITRRATSKILRRMEWGIAAWGGVAYFGGIHCLSIYCDPALGSVVLLFLYVVFLVLFHFLLYFVGFFLTIPTAFSYCCCRCLQIVCVCVFCVWVCPVVIVVIHYIVARLEDC